MVVQTVRYGGGVSVTEKSDCFLEANIDTWKGRPRTFPSWPNALHAEETAKP